MLTEKTAALPAITAKGAHGPDMGGQTKHPREIGVDPSTGKLYLAVDTGSSYSIELYAIAK